MVKEGSEFCGILIQRYFRLLNSDVKRNFVALPTFC
jgi:hypothetical protein